jgi:hypothetical protein
MEANAKAGAGILGALLGWRAFLPADFVVLQASGQERPLHTCDWHA